MTAEPEKLKEPHERKRIRWGCWFAVSLSLPVSYFLSLPFLLALNSHGVLDEPLASAAIDPLVNLMHASEAVNHFYQWYLGLFPLEFLFDVTP